MRLYPAVDLRGGLTVRLRKGDYGEQITYAESPEVAAANFVTDGAECLHVVDLDGAKSGRPEQLDVLARICDSVDVPVQFGGGLREIDDLRSAASVGASLLVLGTAAAKDPSLVAQAVAEFGDRVVASVDARDGIAATDGWTGDSGEGAIDLLVRLGELGVTRFVYSAIERDGTFEGPAVEELKAVCDSSPGRITYAGGIGTLDDLAALRDLALPGLEGVIVGRALHERRFTVRDAVGLLGD